jgi:photosystem II stability/assembly factor-like uncharacterized protein
MDVTTAGRRLVAVGERGYILYSDDNADTWTQADVPVRVSLTAVFFPTAQNGWAVGHDGVILHSKDGGKTWVKQLDGEKINNMVLTQLNRMLKSQTEKKDLENLEFAVEGAKKAVKEGPIWPLMALWFKNDQEGIVVGSFGLILGTADGGKTWTPWLDRIDNPKVNHYYGITRSGDDLFIAGEAGVLFRSGDFGKTWKRLTSPYEGPFFGIIGSPDGELVVAFGLRGRTFCSHDRGANWMEAKKDGFASLSGGTFLSDGSFLIAGVDGNVLRSVDKGKTFITIPTDFPGITSLTETGDRDVVLVGLKGATRIKGCKLGNNCKGKSS